MAGVALVDEGQTNGIQLLALPFIDLRCFASNELLLVADLEGLFPEAYLRDHSPVPTIDTLYFNESAASRRQTYCNRGSNRKWWKSVSAGVFIRSAIRVRSDHLVKTDRANRRIEYAEKWLTRSKTSSKVEFADTETTQISSDLRCRTNGGGAGSFNPDNRHDLEVTGSRRKLIWTGWDRRKSSKRARELEPSRRITNVADSGHLTLGDPIHLSSKRMAERNAEPSQCNQGVDVCETLEAMTRRNRKMNSARGDSAGGGLSDFGFVIAKNRKVRGACVEVDRTFEQSRMVNLLAKMKGIWSCDNRTGKVVDAVGFPQGWTVHVGLIQTGGRVLFEYRDWRSPEGNLWPSFKDASSFLLSTIGDDTASEINALTKAGQARYFEKKLPSTKGGVTCGVNLWEDHSALTNLYFGFDHSQVPVEALNKMNAQKLFVDNVSWTDLGQFVVSSGHRILNMMPMAIGGQVSSALDPWTYLEADSKLLGTKNAWHNWKAGCELHGNQICSELTGKHCLQHMRDLYHTLNKTYAIEVDEHMCSCITIWGTKCSDVSYASCHRDASCGSSYGPNEKCPSCGSIFLAMLELHCTSE